jgi:hypothetical protein
MFKTERLTDLIMFLSVVGAFSLVHMFTGKSSLNPLINAILFSVIYKIVTFFINK